MWTCPFCPLLCDGFRVESLAPPRLAGSDCPRALAALARQDVAAATPRVDGRPATLDEAVAAAAGVLRRARQPLFGGLGTDVAGARALYALAAATGAIADPAGGAALLHGLRVLQDRGAYTTTLAEVHERADLVVFVTGDASARYPELGRRIGAAPTVVLDGPDLFDTVAALALRVAGRPAPPAPAAGVDLDELAARLLAAHYAVLVWDGAALPAHGSLAVESINRIVAVLNRKSRAAAFVLGGADGAATVNAVFTWLSGLPLRSRAGPLGLEHDPLRHDAAQLVADREVDAVLWVASFGTEPPPPATELPLVVIGHASIPVPPDCAVFIPVATPGIGHDGHLVRTDGVVMMKLTRLHDGALPRVADVAARIRGALLS